MSDSVAFVTMFLEKHWQFKAVQHHSRLGDKPLRCIKSEHDRDHIQLSDRLAMAIMQIPSKSLP